MNEARKSDTAKREEETLAFWKEHKIFEKSLQKKAPKGLPAQADEYVFYDGPPFATGLPHYGHIVASVIKDVVPRFWTMRGYHVPRVWGWDCHGLPIENIVEKELGFKHKKDILKMGIAKFNERCREQVLTYAHEWEKIIPRIGRWADMEHAYRTMDKPFMESVWWVFKQLYDKGLVYEDYRSMHICPRCETTLSQQEVSEGYKDVKDIAITVKFKVKNPKAYDLPENTHFLAWTTTPWTLPGNVALAVGKDIKYGIFQEDNEVLIASHQWINLHGKFADTSERSPVGKDFIGSDLGGIKYEPLFDYYANDKDLKNRENGWKVYVADFITTDTGTGIAHEAPAFGADDWELAKKVNLPFVQHVNMDGTMKPEVRDFAGMEVKPRSDDDKIRLGTDIAVLKYLQEHGMLFSKENITHSYPHCWRCDTPLLNYATSSWFVSVTKLKENLLQNAKDINWSPEHIKEGRWGKWLEGARDWSISRQRFWASVIPIWKCEACKKIRVFGSALELEEASGKKVDDLHKHIVDEITVPCECLPAGASAQAGGGVMKRVPDVLDTWFDSGSMPYGERHYPFENKEKFDKAFPAQFIAEGLDQTRAWFYYLHVLAGALFKKNAFQNVIVNGIVLAEDGKKMSKKLQNYPDPMEVVGKYSADALRLYLLASPVMIAENLNFSEKGVAEWKSILTRLENVYEFYALYKGETQVEAVKESQGIMDRWIIDRLRETLGQITSHMDEYNLTAATRPIGDFINDLSMWYVRRSRERIKNAQPGDKSVGVLRWVLMETAKMIAPFAPFEAEWLWRGVSGDDLSKEWWSESVHLLSWSDKLVQEKLNVELLAQMQEVRKIVTLALEAREKAKIRVRQPLASLSIPSSSKLTDEYLSIIADEVNVKEVRKSGDTIALDTNLTDELREEGFVRDTVRAIQEFRKTQNMKPGEKGVYPLQASPAERAIVERYLEYIQKATNTTIQFN